jgi:AcrR family transcriptional regulator
MTQDRRVERTRTALIDAFNHLVMRRRPRKIRVADIVAQANVGRSTFYEHYSGAEAIHVEALSRPFAPIADAAAGNGDEPRVTMLLAHFWQNRQRARETFSGGLSEKASRLLTDMVEARLAAAGAETVIPRRLAAIQLAEAALAPVRAWVKAEASATPEALARSLCRTGAELAAALTAPAGHEQG